MIILLNRFIAQIPYPVNINKYSPVQCHFKVDISLYFLYFLIPENVSVSPIKKSKEISISPAVFISPLKQDICSITVTLKSSQPEVGDSNHIISQQKGALHVSPSIQGK